MYITQTAALVIGNIKSIGDSYPRHTRPYYYAGIGIAFYVVLYAMSFGAGRIVRSLIM